MKTILIRSKKLRVFLFYSVLFLFFLSVQAHADFTSELSSNFEIALSAENNWVTLGLIFLAGLATSLTPCVYPMIAITVSVFGAKQASTRSHAALLSTCYVLGMATLFVPLGLISAISGFAFGALLSNPFVIVAMSAFFFIMAFSMFGLFNLSLPSSLQTKLATMGGAGYKGAFVLGLVGGLIAAPCTGPVLAVLLTWLSTTGDIGFGALSLFVYALGLGTLFWWVGTFAMSLPKSGKWMEGVKSLFGISMMLLGLFFLKPFYSHLISSFLSYFSGWIFIACILIGVLIGALHLSYFASSWKIRLRKTAGIVLVLLGTLGWIEHSLQPSTTVRLLTWEENFVASFEKAKKQNRPLILDFTAEWCGACKEIEAQVLHHPDVQDELQRFIRVKVDLSAGQATDEKWALLKSYNQPGLPFIVIHKSNGEVIERVTGMVEAKSFVTKISTVR